MVSYKCACDNGKKENIDNAYLILMNFIQLKKF